VTTPGSAYPAPPPGYSLCLGADQRWVASGNEVAALGTLTGCPKRDMARRSLIVVRRAASPSKKAMSRASKRRPAGDGGISGPIITNRGLQDDGRDICAGESRPMAQSQLAEPQEFVIVGWSRPGGDAAASRGVAFGLLHRRRPRGAPGIVSHDSLRSDGAANSALWARLRPE
jgi:hypothetical protein